MFNFFKKKEYKGKLQTCSLVNLTQETEAFFQELEKEFSFLLFDELLILKKLSSGGYELVHHSEHGKNPPTDTNWRDRVIENMDFFLGRILKKDALSDGEGVFAWHQEGALFDLVIRERDYYIALNNSTESLSNLMKKHPFNETKLIQFLGKFSRQLDAKIQ